MANVLFKRGSTATINGTAIADGQLLYNTTTGQQYIDSGSTRKEVGKPVDTALSTTSTNAIANNALTNSIINTTAEVNAITADNIPCGTKPVKELNQSLLDVEDKTKWKLIATINAKTSTTVNLSQYNEIRIEPYNISLADAYQQVGSYPVSALSATVKRIDVPINHAGRARYNVTLTNITLLLSSAYNESTDYTVGMVTYVYAR